MLLSDFYMHFLIRHLSSFRNPPEALKNELVNKSHKTKRVEIHKYIAYILSLGVYKETCLQSFTKYLRLAVVFM